MYQVPVLTTLPTTYSPTERPTHVIAYVAVWAPRLAADLISRIFTLRHLLDSARECFGRAHVNCYTPQFAGHAKVRVFQTCAC